MPGAGELRLWPSSYACRALEAESWLRTTLLSRLRFRTMPPPSAKAKIALELGECGTCTVLVDGTPVLSCLVLGLACAGHQVKTVEGMAAHGTLHPLQEAFAELGAAQCGY